MPEKQIIEEITQTISKLLQHILLQNKMWVLWHYDALADQYFAKNKPGDNLPLYLATAVEDIIKSKGIILVYNFHAGLAHYLDDISAKVFHYCHDCNSITILSDKKINDFKKYAHTNKFTSIDCNCDTISLVKMKNLGNKLIRQENIEG